MANAIKQQGETRPRGMQEGHLVYTKKDFLKHITEQYQTTNEILKKINLAPIRDVSWNTLQKYLILLADEKRIEKRTAGRINLWRKEENVD